jgi:hypothetical protein
LSDKINNSENNHADLKYKIESCRRDREELILDVVREWLKHEDLVKFAITHHCDRSFHELDCAYIPLVCHTL